MYVKRSFGEQVVAVSTEYLGPKSGKGGKKGRSERLKIPGQIDGNWLTFVALL